ncbi:hypothetical protein ACJX0J_038193 [Zea mays]
MIYPPVGSLAIASGITSLLYILLLIHDEIISTQGNSMFCPHLSHHLPYFLKLGVVVLYYMVKLPDQEGMKMHLGHVSTGQLGIIKTKIHVNSNILDIYGVSLFLNIKPRRIQLLPNKKHVVDLYFNKKTIILDYLRGDI